jgi:hypothetical protein
MSDLKLLHSIHNISTVDVCGRQAGRESKNCRNDRHLLPAANLNNRRERERERDRILLLKVLRHPPHLMAGSVFVDKAKFNFECVL